MWKYLSIAKDFVRKAPQYQQFPQKAVTDVVWQRVATFLYAIKMYLIHGNTIRQRLKNLDIVQNSKECRPVLILGNGPSLSDLSSAQIRRLKQLNAEFIVMNDFHKNVKLAKAISPTYWCIGDPVYEEDSIRINMMAALANYPNCIEVRPAWIQREAFITDRPLFVNPINACGLGKSFSPKKWRHHPDGVIFTALLLAKFAGYSPIYVIGADNSYYLNHYLTDDMKIKCLNSGLHAYAEAGESSTIPYLTRSMKDVLYAHARFLNDLERLCSSFAINVGTSDITNDALPRACLLK